MTDRDTFQSWLTAYGAAWEKLDAEAYLPLFSEDAAYYWTPFEAPHRGHDAILAALVDAIARQGDPSFSATVIAVEGDIGWAQWSCSFTRKGTDDPVRIEGVLKAVFRDGKCCEFREWLHALEPGQGDLMRDIDA